ncbi:MAG: tetratricopeptide repeat protein [Parvularculaceae bacterium]
MAVRILATHQPAQRMATVALCAVLMSACASSGKSLHADGEKVNYKEEVGVFTDPGAPGADMDPVAAAAFWGSRYDRNPKDVNAAINYSAALRKINSNDEAVKVMTRVANSYPEHADANLEAGKTLVEAGRAFEAVRFLEKATELAPQDWRTFSAYGVALDQIGEHKLARTKYDMALVFAPGAPMLLNNKGLSFALDGDLEKAKQHLRAAASTRGADARIRQNLALVLAMKGEMREAERLARSDLPPQIADQNIDYFRSLMNQPAYWQELAADNVETPTFDEPVAEAPKSAPKAAKPTPAPLLKEEPKQEEKKPATPVALKEGATTPTAASASAPALIDEPSAPTPLVVDAPKEEAPAPMLKDN